MTLPAIPLALALCIVLPPAQQTPSDARSNQFEDPRGSTWRVFGVDSYPDGPLGIVEVQEVRQHNPPSTWAVFVQNRSGAPVASYAVAAAIVSGDGTVRAIQALPAIRNLGPAKVSRQELRVRVTVLVPSDRVVFFVKEVTDAAAPWRAVNADVAKLIRPVAERLPAP